MDYTTLLELSVLFAASVAVVFSVWSLFVSHTDHLVLRKLDINGVKHLTVVSRLGRDLARVGCAGVMFTAAVRCLHLPPDHTPTAVTLKVALLFTALFLALAVMMDFRWRHVIDRALEAEDP
jgi:hypothetical protein